MCQWIFSKDGPEALVIKAVRRKRFGGGPDDASGRMLPFNIRLGRMSDDKNPTDIVKCYHFATLLRGNRCAACVFDKKPVFNPFKTDITAKFKINVGARVLLIVELETHIDSSTDRY